MKAELELGSTKEDRILLLERVLEDQASRKKLLGQREVALDSVVQAKADLLSIEIEFHGESHREQRRGRPHHR